MELLVVVLIIGVLAAIAVPQYQKAVLKSRFSSLMPTTQAIRDGNEMYYMTNGGYANDVAKLDVTTANTEDMTITLSDDSDYAYTMATRPNINNNLIMYQKHSVNFPGEIHCEALKGSSQAEWLCGTALHAVKELGEVITEGYITYVLEGTGNGLTPGADDGTMDCDKAIEMGFTCTVNESGTEKKICKNGVCRTKTLNEDGGYISVTCQVNEDNVCTSNWRSSTYNDKGNKISERYCRTVDSNGNCEKYTTGGYYYTYDDNGNITYQGICDSLDSNGNCVEYRDGYAYTYDANGNQTYKRSCKTADITTGKCTEYNTSGGTEYTYDDNGRVTSERRCNAVDSTTGKCTAYDMSYGYDYSYDGDKTTQRNCRSVNSTTGECTYSSVTDYTYDDNGNNTFWGRCMSSSTIDSTTGKCTAYEYGYKYTYDTDGNKTSGRYCTSVNSTTGECTSYGGYGFYYDYDTNGNQTSQRYCTSVDRNTGDCTAYNNANTYDYTYDGNGNMLTSRTCSSVDSEGKCTAYRSGTDYTYDANGNQTYKRSCKTADITTGKCTEYNTSGGTEYTYDDKGYVNSERTCSTVDSTTGNCTRYSGNTYVYIYDDDGKQILQQACYGSNLNTDTGECIAYNSMTVSAN